MKLHQFLLFFFLYFNYLQAQKANIHDKSYEINQFIKKGDSLNKLPDHDAALNTYQMGLAMALDNNSHAQAAILYKKIGVYYHKKQQYSIAEINYRRGLKRDSISTVAGDLYFNISLIKKAVGQNDSIMPYLETSLGLFNNHEINKGACNAYLSAGINYKERQLYEKALKYLIKSYKGFQIFNNKKKLADVCSIIGNVQNHLKNYNQALYYYQKALKYQKETNHMQGLGRTYVNIANTSDNLKKYDSAIFYYKRGLKFLESKNKSKATAMYNLADTYLTIGETKLAENYFKGSIRLSKTLTDTISFLYGYNGLINLYLKEGSFKRAEMYLDSLSPLAQLVSDKVVTLNYYENQSEFYNKIKNYKGAYEYQLHYNNLYKEIYNKEQAEVIQNLEIQFDNTNKENEILKLTLTNKNNELRLVEKNRDIENKNRLLIILVFVVVSLIVLYYALRQKQKGIAQHLKIEKLEAIYNGQEIIKKRIARDLHDIITTNFDGLRLKILALKRSKHINSSIDTITKDLKNVNQQIRVVSHRLYPLEIQVGKQKFTDIIKSRLSEFQLYGNVYVELEVPLPKELDTTSLIIQNNFYGILLEVLNNIEKHSHATKLTLNSFIENKRMHFIFLDNGIGIEQNSKEGIGILNIKQRCEILEGSCSIKKVESGTEVYVNFPLKKPCND
ncbi:tetratricopeptide repeat-containing sensor histidine kinase [Flavivirga rizhaonensis]|uniref:Histidine kinase/HSP90-like ATPase domain-containing protein n=1 Tax=Flavivirga rizhaonensis TaxID=2559571 RepID=A0A4S1DV04_9FLAO|nr:tetratricopeptide repeat-containing sensor histidine kinase [Flavivirga rizhaonensis]TGV01799.1 hypothetical protein EM932_14085 [Flavivirga rizhaonensis]